MDPFVNEKDFELLSRDRYTFAVLARILRGDCRLIRADHRSLILCHSDTIYPVWIWTPDGLTETEKEAAWDLAAENCPFSQGYRYNIKYELAEYFIRRSEACGPALQIRMRICAYDCPSLLPPQQAADGAPHGCTPDDLPEAAALFARFYSDIGEESPPQDRLLEKVRTCIDDHALFFWKNAAGRTVACCSFKASRGLASLGSVYTLPEHRRRHYATHLVYHVTKTAADLGLIPMLYTDADYPASNACYMKIGYVLRGELCTVGPAV